GGKEGGGGGAPWFGLVDAGRERGGGWGPPAARHAGRQVERVEAVDADEQHVPDAVVRAARRCNQELRRKCDGQRGRYASASSRLHGLSPCEDVRYFGRRQ